jgi:phage baseplate assembly protein gpV
MVMTANLPSPTTVDSELQPALQTWVYLLWQLIRNFDTTSTVKGSTQIDGNLVVTGSFTVTGGETITGGLTVDTLTVTGNETIDGNLTLDGTFNGTASYTILLGVYSGLLD